MPPDREPTLGHLLGAAAGPFEIAHAGRTWKVGWPTQRAREAFNRAIKRDAYEEARADDLEFAGGEAVKQFHRDSAARHYAPGGKLWLDKLNTPRANVLYLYALLREHHPEATPEDAARLARAEPDLVKDVVAEVTPPFLGLLAEDDQMPPPVAALLRGLAENPQAAAPGRPTPGGGSTSPP